MQMILPNDSPMMAISMFMKISWIIKVANKKKVQTTTLSSSE